MTEEDVALEGKRLAFAQQTFMRILADTVHVRWGIGEATNTTAVKATGPSLILYPDSATPRVFLRHTRVIDQLGDCHMQFRRHFMQQICNFYNGFRRIQLENFQLFHRVIHIINEIIQRT